MSDTQKQNPKSGQKIAGKSASAGKGKDAAPGRSDPGQAKNSPRGADSREIAKEQGKPGDTPMRDHERERTDAKPKAAPSHPPDGHDEASDIDEAEQAR